MKVIRTKKDVESFLNEIKESSEEFVFHDPNLSINGGWTAINYDDSMENFYIYSWGTGWSDIGRTYLTDAVGYVWGHRKHINKELKNQ